MEEGSDSTKDMEDSDPTSLPFNSQDDIDMVPYSKDLP